MLKPKTDAPRGVLYHKRNEPYIGVERYLSSPELAPFVEHYWTFAWEHQPRVVRETVPHPSVHLVFEPGDSKLHGVHVRRFSRVIEGKGRVLGVKFLTRGISAFDNQAVRELTGKVVHPKLVFGEIALEIEAKVVVVPEAEQEFHLIDAFLKSRSPMAL